MSHEQVPPPQQRPDNRALQTAIEASLQDIRREEDELVERALRLSLANETARREERFERRVEEARRVSEPEEQRSNEARENDELRSALRLSAEMAERQQQERLRWELEEARRLSLRGMMADNERAEQREGSQRGGLNFGHGYVPDPAEAGHFPTNSTPSAEPVEEPTTTAATSSPSRPAMLSQDIDDEVPAAEAARQATLRRYVLVSTGDA